MKDEIPYGAYRPSPTIDDVIPNHGINISKLKTSIGKLHGEWLRSEFPDENWLRNELPRRLNAVANARRRIFVRPLSILDANHPSVVQSSLSGIKIYGAYGMAMLRHFRKLTWALVSGLAPALSPRVKHLVPALAAIIFVAVAALAGWAWSPIAKAPTTGGLPPTSTNVSSSGSNNTLASITLTTCDKKTSATTAAAKPRTTTSAPTGQTAQAPAPTAPVATSQPAVTSTPVGGMGGGSGTPVSGSTGTTSLTGTTPSDPLSQTTNTVTDITQPVLDPVVQPVNNLLGL